MNASDVLWERRVADLWKAIDEYEPEEFVAQLDVLVAELPPGSAIGLFERGAAQDSTGHPDLAVPLYQAARETGLGGPRRRRAAIQMASSLRNLGLNRKLALQKETVVRRGAAIFGFCLGLRPPLWATSPGAALELRLRMTATSFDMARMDSTDAPSFELVEHPTRDD